MLKMILDMDAFSNVIKHNGISCKLLLLLYVLRIFLSDKNNEFQPDTTC